MPDREKVIKALELCDIGSGNKCYETECPYYQNGCTERLKDDALELLKAQQKTPVVFRQFDGSIESECGNCGLNLDKTYSVCPKCGKELDWNA